MIERRIYKKIKDHLKERQVTVITGIRRCGKTTLMKMLFNSIKSKNKLYLDLEAISNRIFFDENKYENILLKLQNIYGLTTDSKIYLALDEIQYVFQQIYFRINITVKNNFRKTAEFYKIVIKFI